MQKICDLKNRISVLRALLREQEEKLKVLEAIEKEKEEMWLRERAHQTDVECDGCAQGNDERNLAGKKQHGFIDMS